MKFEDKKNIFHFITSETNIYGSFIPISFKNNINVQDVFICYLEK